MKKLGIGLFAFGALVMGSQAFAEPVKLAVTLRSNYSSSVGLIEIRDAGNGKLEVTHDKNICGINGCTEMFFAPQIVDPKVIEDRRGSDGDLVLQLTPEIQLIVGSGFNIEGKITFVAKVNQEKELSVIVELNSITTLGLLKK